MPIHYAFVVEITKKQRKNKKQRKEHEKNEEKEKEQDNLILLHVNITFLLIGPYAFTHGSKHSQRSHKGHQMSNFVIKKKSFFCHLKP
jgi:hypothetical protein